MPSILFACSGLTFERVFEPWGGVNEEELGLVLCYHLVILLDGLSKHVLRKLVLGVRHKQLQGHTQTTSRSHTHNLMVTHTQCQSHKETTLWSHRNNYKVTLKQLQGHTHATLWSHTHNFKVTHNLMVTHKQLQSHTETTSKSPRDNLKVVNVHVEVCSYMHNGQLSKCANSRHCQWGQMLATHCCECCRLNNIFKGMFKGTGFLTLKLPGIRLKELAFP